MTSNSPLYSVPDSNSPGAQVPNQGDIYQQKEAAAQAELEKILGNYRTQYDTISDKIRQHNQYASFMNSLQSGDGTDLLQKDLANTTSQADVANRMNQLYHSTGSSSSWYMIFLDVLFWILVVVAGYFAFTKISKYTTPKESVISGGNRLTTK
uniref:Uncharacterized protein n=1 Tax=viral metagenome TaxID=1070528 RepID=A0A6C0CJ62_9ZZZZ